MYEWSDIAPLVNDLLKMVIRTCEARWGLLFPLHLAMDSFFKSDFRPDAKLMAIRQKYSNKKFGKIALVAQSKISLLNEMKGPEFATSSPK
jgi:hypothetical protein